MKKIYLYKPPGEEAPFLRFLAGTEPKMRKKLQYGLRCLACFPEYMTEPHVKHFSIERYNRLYEYRERIRILVRVIGSPAVLKDVRMVHEDNQHLMIKTFEVPPDFDLAGLTEADFKKNGYSYKMSYLLQVSENYSHKSKLASQTVTITHKEKDEAVAKLAPLLDYSEGGFSGQLTLNLDSIFTEPSNQSSYTYRLTETREYTGFERNDTYGVPKTVNKGGATLQLVDVSWTPMGDGRYNAAYFGGRYNVVQRLRLNYYDPIIDLTHTSLDSREYLVDIDRWPPSGWPGSRYGSSAPTGR